MAENALQDPAALARGAAEHLARGDVAAAERWSHRALARSPRSAVALHTLAEIARQRGDDDRALGEELLALERFGFDPDLVLGMAQHYASLGDGTAGLRLLLRYRESLERSVPLATRIAMEKLGEGLPRTTITGIRQSLHLAGEAVSPAQARLYRRLASLRRDHRRPDRVVQSVPTRDGYRTAPGVVPAAPRR